MLKNPSMVGTLSITGRSAGSRKALFSGFSVPLPHNTDGADGITLRQLIAHVVQHEVKQFAANQQARRLDRVMSAVAIEQGLARGRVDPAAKPAAITDQKVDTNTAVANGWQAFEDGIYLILIDEIEQRNLDQQAYLKPDSRLTFIRLVFLAGA